MKKILNAHATGALLLTLLLWGSAGPESPVADAAMHTKEKNNKNEKRPKQKK
jgi:hypothetical protein